MPDIDSERLEELERRWRREPGSGLFLQLAEEYRRTGRRREALEVLDAGLERNPDYTSAKVARGRCLLELDRPGEAIAALEDVVEQDSTHLVARKLLVEAHVQRGDALAARRQLDLYAALSASDPEVDSLRQRIQELQLDDAAPAQEAEEEPAQEAEEPSASVPPLVTAGAGPMAAGADPAAAPMAEAAMGPRMRAASLTLGAEEPFAALASEADLSAFVTRRAPSDDQIFPFDLLDAAPAAAVPAGDAPPVAGAVPEPAAAIAPQAGPAAAVAELDEEDDTLAAGSPATSTLGHLYLRQGHAAEAAGIFQRVLARDPDQAEALAGLREAEQTLAADRTGEAASAPSTGSPEERKARLLRRYLALLRQVGARDVP